ncbi:unnamed protein product [Bursaphelenchus xylophilus]|uniref:(pine wood nematode) hypothetical protein n=1 Tax=Bursaphelenchus xylophilus TaxID=6326 RepID=A0A7I8X6C9_BURXY|nr:unnamed protein product [Bursaphelenchus xylophilus]CAG9123084.1 unnamed protein product [Bursaphelenchus xylophilus]
MNRFWLLLTCAATVSCYSKPYPYEDGMRKHETEFGEFSKNVHPHVIRKYEHEIDYHIDSNGDMIRQIGKNVKPKDYSAWNLFVGFMDKHNKVYKHKKEVLHRFKIYKRNIKAAKMWQENEQGSAFYGETQFMDMTATEFKNIYLPYVWPQVPNSNTLSPEELIALEDVELPDSFDWRQKGVVTDVKNQGSCGSCWAFSVTGNIEGQWALKTKKLVPLSEQELLDCDVIDQACNGGLPLNAYKEIIRLGGLETEDEYPYEQEREASCKIEKSELAAFINGSLQLPKDEQKIAAYLLKHGPISIGVNANPLQFYRHGISHPWKIFCSPLMLNHGVLIVGFGQEGNKPFWIIKNSWGSRWGESGYYRLYRGKNVCGVSEMATTALIE